MTEKIPAFFRLSFITDVSIINYFLANIGFDGDKVKLELEMTPMAY